MEKLARTYADIKDIPQTIEWWKQILGLLEHAEESQKLRKISAMNQLLLNLIIRDESSNDETTQLEAELHDMLLRMLPAEHEQMLDFLSSKAHVLLLRGQPEEAEQIYRHALQTRLTSYGP